MKSMFFAPYICSGLVIVSASGRTLADPQVPLLEMRVVPAKLFVPQPCPPTLTTTLQFRNNALEDPITIDWTSRYVAHSLTCVSDYAPKMGAGLVIPAQTVSIVTITLSFIEDCIGTTTIEFQGEIPGSDPLDTETAVLTVNCDQKPPITPTTSEWGVIAMVLLVLSVGTIGVRRRRRARIAA